MPHWWEEEVKEHLKFAETKPEFTKASGALNKDNDLHFEVAGELYQGECKERDKPNIIISASDWNHLESQAWKFGRIPVLFSKSSELELVTMDIASYKYLLLALQQYHNQLNDNK